eukprot:6560147-Alexandrium_andersonii.AAC.1
MCRSITLDSMLSVYLSMDKHLQTYDTLIAAIEQWLDRQRISQITQLEREKEAEKGYRWVFPNPAPAVREAGPGTGGASPSASAGWSWEPGECMLY